MTCGPWPKRRGVLSHEALGAEVGAGARERHRLGLRAPALRRERRARARAHLLLLGAAEGGHNLVGARAVGADVDGAHLHVRGLRSVARREQVSACALLRINLQAALSVLPMFSVFLVASAATRPFYTGVLFNSGEAGVLTLSCSASLARQQLWQGPGRRRPLVHDILATGSGGSAGRDRPGRRACTEQAMKERR